MATVRTSLILALLIGAPALPVDALAQANTSTTQAASTDAASSSWRGLVGLSLTLLVDDYAEFEEHQGILVAKNDSRWRGALVTGLGLDLNWKKLPNLGLFAGLEYAPSTSNILDAVTLGFTFRLHAEAYLLAGFSASRGKELSAGFRRSANAWNNQTEGVSKVTLEGDKDYDGLPLTEIGYQGRVITESWNKAFVVGLALPISVSLGSKKAPAGAGGSQ